MKAETGGRLTAGPEISSQLGYKAKSRLVLQHLSHYTFFWNFYILLTLATYIKANLDNIFLLALPGVKGDGIISQQRTPQVMMSFWR